MLAILSSLLLALWPGGQEPAPQLPTYRPLPAWTAHVQEPRARLDGEWSFHPSPPDGWWKDDGPGLGWRPIAVPGEWVLQGFTVDPEAFAAYRRTVEVPAEWFGGRIALRFDGVFSAARVFVNGTEVGGHVGGFTAFELDVTDALRPGTNRLDVAVRSWSEADLLGSMSQYAAHPLGGILRKVTLFTVPDVHVADLRVDTRLEASGAAVVRLSVEVVHAGGTACGPIALRASVAGTDATVDLPGFAPGARERRDVELRLAQPVLWDPEHPVLHLLGLDLRVGGAPVEALVRRVGIRQIEVRGDRLCVNGRPVKLRGVDRHEIHPLRGRATNEDDARRDVLLFRAANCNYVRTSHYPPTEEFLDACDELGMFVEVEAPICWVGHGANRNWQELDHLAPGWAEYLVRANLETVQLHRNHPSVLMWSLANESVWSPSFAQALAAVAAADPTRPQSFHDQCWGGYNNAGSTAPVANFHYPGPGGPRHVAEAALGRPVLFGEYCHLSVYDRREIVADPSVRDAWGMLLAPMWESMQATPGVLGGALWSGIDDVFVLPDGRSVGYGPWGVIDGWRRQKPETWHVRESYAPVRVLTRDLPAEGPFRVEVENRFLFTNLRDVRVRWSRDYGAHGELRGPPLEPGQRGVMEVDAAGSGPLRLSFDDPRGFAAEDVKLAVGAPPDVDRTGRSPTQERVGIGTEAGAIVATAGAIRLEVDGATGLIRRVERDGLALLVGGPLLYAVPLVTDACAPEFQAELPPLNDPCVGWRCEGFESGLEDGAAVVRVRGAYDEAAGMVTLRLDGSGTLAVDGDFELSVDTLVPRQVGLVFDLPSAFEQVEWRRRAQWSVYPDDHIGRPEGVAPAFWRDCPEPVAAGVAPTWSWSHDATPLGCNDFRATRWNFLSATMRASDRRTVTAVGDGTSHFRCWIEGPDRVRMLIASHAVPTGESFVRAHVGPWLRELRRGDRLRVRAELSLGDQRP